MIIFDFGKCKPMTFATFEMSTKSVGFSTVEIASSPLDAHVKALGERMEGAVLSSSAYQIPSKAKMKRCAGRITSFCQASLVVCILATPSGEAFTTRHVHRQGRLRHQSTTRLYVFNVEPEESILMEQTSTKEILDGIIDDCLRTSGRRPIMIQFEPSSKAIWSHYRGTVFAETWKSCVQGILWAASTYLWLNGQPRLQTALAEFSSLYMQLLSVTTFTLTFFVNQSYTIWRTCLQTCRTLQGRMNDLIMSIAGFSQRVDEKPPGSSIFSENAKRMLTITARYIRLFNILSYASLTRSHRPLLTPQGMRRMVARGLMTAKERTLLIEAQIPATQRHNAVLMWILRLVIEGRKAGLIDGGFGFEQILLTKIQEIRAQGNSMESVLKGRMPFAYAHFVQILVDAVVWMYPFVAFTRGSSLFLTLMGSGLMTLCYQGLFDLAKRFLDPFHNENFWRGDDPLIVDTLIAETNSGSMRWMYCLDEMPISYRSISKGMVDEFLLPNEGFTREEAEEEEARKRAEEEEKELSAEERNERLFEAIETAEEEFEETKRILKAPPGSDFISDDQDNRARGDADESGEEDDIFDEFLEAAEDELELDRRRRAEV
jgi:hypothetical protein